MNKPSTGSKRIGIIGLGNVLMGDDAFGPYVTQVLEANYLFPENVVLMDLGTPSLDLVSHIEELDAAIIIDCVHSKGQPGELRFYNRDEILGNPIQPRISPHEPGLKEAILIAEFHGYGPGEALLIGVIPEATLTGVGLSSAARDAIPKAVEAVLEELKRLGVETLPRPAPLQPKIWWEQQSQHFYQQEHVEPGLAGLPQA